MKRATGLRHTKSIQRNFLVSYSDSILYPWIALLYKKGGTLHQVRLTTGQLIYLLKSGTNLRATCKYNIPSISWGEHSPSHVSWSMLRLLINFASCFKMGKAQGQETLSKCGANLFSLGPLFLEYPYHEIVLRMPPP